MAGRKPGTPKTGGRQKGVPNKATRTLKEIAREYTAEAVEALVGIIRDSDSDAAKVSAAKEILDRGYGKASVVLSGDEDGGPIKAITEIRLVSG
jgi:hypothetical protein